MNQKIRSQTQHAGLKHWRLHRISAAILVPLIPWLLGIAFPHLVNSPHGAVQQWLASRWGGVPAFLLTLSLFYHGFLGMQVILEDYLPFDRRVRWIGILKLASFGGAICGIVALVKIWWS